MSKRGWVSVEDPAGDWWVLQVYEDGWVEVPGRARDLADNRAQLRVLLPGLAGVLVLFGASVVLGRFDVPVAPSLLALAGFGVLVVTGVRARRFRIADHHQARADDEQTRRLREQGRRLRVREGQSAWQRSRTSAHHAQVMAGVRRVGAEHLSRVDVRVPPSAQEPVVVDVWFHDGSWLGYRTPDRTVVRLFSPWTRGPVPG